MSLGMQRHFRVGVVNVGLNRGIAMSLSPSRPLPSGYSVVTVKGGGSLGTDHRRLHWPGASYQGREGGDVVADMSGTGVGGIVRLGRGTGTEERRKLFITRNQGVFLRTPRD